MTAQAPPAANGTVSHRLLEPAAAMQRFPHLRARPNLAFALALDDADGGVAVEHDLFDSEIFGRQIGRIVDVEEPTSRTRAALLESVAPVAQRQGFNQLLRRTPAAELIELWALGRAGFELMDVGVVFARAPQTDLPAERSDITIRPATDDDITEISDELLSLPWGSRYESDPTYTLEQVAELRRRWLWNSHRGRAEVVLIAEIDGRPAAFATCVLDAPSREGDIELVGTLPVFRGRGAAAHVVAHAVAWLAEHADLVTVRTQATNTPAARVYLRAGFTLHTCDMTFRISLPGESTPS